MILINLDIVMKTNIYFFILSNTHVINYIYMYIKKKKMLPHPIRSYKVSIDWNIDWFE